MESGAIGALERVETTPPNVYDWGTHANDFVGTVVGDRPAEWVLGGIDYREEKQFFGAHNENQAFALWEYDNGVSGVISTGGGRSMVPAFFRFVGAEGILELVPEHDEADLWWRVRGDRRWERESVDGDEWTGPIDAAIEHVIESLDAGSEPELCARNALNATEIVFGIWESSRRRGRVDFPLEIDDNPLEAMVESGELVPEPVDE